jgi:DNA polymerase-3 subunit delta'
VEPRGAHEILVDDVRRQVVREVSLRPFEASRRVFVIADAERMNDESQNALLKSLEEPSPFAHLVLVSSAPGRLLPTIPSRCRHVAFGPVPAERIAELLTENGVEESLAIACARLSGGDVGKARWLAGDGAEQRREAEAAARSVFGEAAGDDAEWALAAPWRPLLERAAERAAAAEAQVKEDLEEVLEREPKKGRRGLVTEFERQARRAHRRAHTASLDRSLELVSSWYRDLVAVAAGAERVVVHADRLAELREDGTIDRMAAAERAAEIVRETWRSFEEFNVQPRLALEALFIRLRRELAVAPTAV